MDSPPPTPSSASSLIDVVLDYLNGKWYFYVPITLAFSFLAMRVLFCNIRSPVQTDDQSSSPRDIEHGTLAPTEQAPDESSPSQDIERGGSVPAGSHFVIQVPICTFEDAGGVADTCCTICLEDFMAADQVVSPYNCKHIFHIDCVDMWINHGIPQSICCPNCRSTVCIKEEEHSVRDR